MQDELVHAQEDVGAHPLGRVVEHRAHVQIDRLDRAEGPLDVGEALVGSHRRIGIELRRGQTGADHIQAIEGCLGRDAFVLALPGEARVGDGELEVLGHVVAIQAAPGAQCNRARPAQQVAASRHGRAGELRFGRLEQLGALARALLGEQRIATPPGARRGSGRSRAPADCAHRTARAARALAPERAGRSGRHAGC